MSSVPVRTALDSRSYGSPMRRQPRIPALFVTGPFSVFLNISSFFGFQQSITTGLDFICILHKLETFSAGMFSTGLFCSFCFPSVTSVTRGQRPSHFPREQSRRLFFLIRVFLPLRLTGIAVRACVVQAGPKLAT